MIKGFKHKGLKQFFETGSTKGIQVRHSDKIRVILATLDAAIEVEDMRLPAFRLHKLSGIRKEFWSVWVNGNWRITFKFENGGAEIVNYEDYH